MSTRFDWKLVRTELMQLEALVDGDRGTSPDGVIGMVRELCGFADTVADVGALRQAFALLMVERRERWDPAASLWAAIIATAYPQLERQRRSELSKIMSVAGQLPPHEAMLVIEASGGTEVLGRASELELRVVRKRTKTRYGRKWRPESF